jgi:hypothetical protein
MVVTEPGYTELNVREPVDQRTRAAVRTAAWALLALTVLSVPALMLPTPQTTTWTVVRAALVVVAALDVVVGWGLWLLVRSRAPRLGLAALVSRAGYAVVLAAAALTVAAPADCGDLSGRWWGWSVFAVHLLVAAVALRCAGAPGLVWVATGLAGCAYLLSVVPWQVVPDAVLMPFQCGEVVLLVWLFVVSRRTAPDGGTTS